MNMFFYTDGKDYFKSYVEVFRAPYRRVTDKYVLEVLYGKQATLTLLQPDPPFNKILPSDPNANEMLQAYSSIPQSLYSAFTPTGQQTITGSAFELLSVQGGNIPSDLQINPALTNKPAGPTIPQLTSQSNTNLFTTSTAPQQPTTTTQKASAGGNGWLLLIALFGGAYFLRKK